jgi:predicted lipid-binding transport protein (Tim44 family)
MAKAAEPKPKEETQQQPPAEQPKPTPARRKAGAAKRSTFSLEQGLCWGALGVAALLLLLFLLDLIIGVPPLNKASILLDICGILASGLIIYLCYDTLKDMK